MDWQRFTILEHSQDERFHWDLLFETGEVLTTFALPQPLVETLLTDGKAKGETERLPDHRTIYLDYQGPISNGRGSVTQIDTGLYAAESDGFHFSGGFYCGDMSRFAVITIERLPTS